MTSFLELFEKWSEHQFQDPSLLTAACWHSSMGPSHGEHTFERLEFLGDRVLGLVITEALYKQHPDKTEGELSLHLTKLVCRAFLVEVGQRIELHQHLQVQGILPDQKDRALADACEAVIGALYLDGGLCAVRPFIERFWGHALKAHHIAKDAKSRLQEATQSRGWGLPQYKNVDVQDDASGLFSVLVSLPTQRISAQGCGVSKKEAQQKAAENLLHVLGEHTS